MENNYQLQIYKGMIQYLLESTNYTLKSIADLSDSSVKNIKSIYYDDFIPQNFTSELQLVKLYLMILEINFNKNDQFGLLIQSRDYQRFQHREQ